MKKRPSQHKRNIRNLWHQIKRQGSLVGYWRRGIENRFSFHFFFRVCYSPRSKRNTGKILLLFRTRLNIEILTQHTSDFSKWSVECNSEMNKTEREREMKGNSGKEQGTRWIWMQKVHHSGDQCTTVERNSDIAANSIDSNAIFLGNESTRLFHEGYLKPWTMSHQNCKTYTKTV
jgi:hypothetical protein